MNKYLLYFTLSLCFFSAIAKHSCVHDTHKKFPIEFEDFSEEGHGDDRNLATVTYNNIRIYFDFSKVSGLAADVKNYMMNKLIAPTKNYFESALKVVPLTSNLTFSATKPCGISVASTWKTQGVAADLVVFVTTTNEPSASYLAYASICVQASNNGRPVVGQLNFNTGYISSSTSYVKVEDDLSTTMHELSHILGFSSDVYASFIDPTTNKKLTGHVITKTINGVSSTLINVAPLTTRVRNHFNCPTLEGGLIEQQGGSGSAGSHWERRVFYNEYMTASSIEDPRVSEFTLGLLEGSGWYQVNYTLAEPMTWGKNEGCNFIYSTCIDKSTKKANFKEFCAPLDNLGCSWTYRGGAACGPHYAKADKTVASAYNYWGNSTALYDIFSDNCPYYMPYSNTDCLDSTLLSGAALPDKEFYGEGSRCFIGTLYNGGALASPYPYCFTTTCTLLSSGSYSLTVNVGSTSVTCSTAGPISVSGLGGQLTCPDPNAFCYQKETEGYCKRRCMGRGTCTNKACVCQPGWTGVDCSVPAYVDKCTKCASKAGTTSCYGDVCACPQNDANCARTYGSPSSPVTFSFTSTSVTKQTETDSPTFETFETVHQNQNNSQNDSNNLIYILAAVAGGAAVIIAGVVVGMKYGKRFTPKKQPVKQETAKTTGFSLPPETKADDDMHPNLESPHPLNRI